MLTCKDFLSELSDYLDEAVDAEVRSKLEKHITECPNCWVIADESMINGVCNKIAVSHKIR